MEFKKFIKSVLSNKEITDLTSDRKVYFLHASNASPPYVEYEIINEYGIEHCEGEEKFTEYLVQVDIFSKNDYSNLESIIKKHMKENGFNRDSAIDLYEEDTKLFHKGMRFSISVESE